MAASSMAGSWASDRHDIPGSVELPQSSSSIEPHAAANGLHHRSVAAAAAPVDVPASDSRRNSSDVEAQVPSTSDPAPKDPAAEDEDYNFKEVSWMDIVKQFSILGWTAFGGPAAHIGLMQRVSASYVPL